MFCLFPLLWSSSENVLVYRSSVLSSLVFIRERVSLQISLVLKCESHHFPHAYQHNADACDEKRVWSLHHWICLSENRFIMFSGVTNLNENTENWIAFQNKQSSWNIDTILPKTGVDSYYIANTLPKHTYMHAEWNCENHVSLLPAVHVRRTWDFCVLLVVVNFGHLSNLWVSTCKTYSQVHCSRKKFIWFVIKTLASSTFYLLMKCLKQSHLILMKSKDPSCKQVPLTCHCLRWKWVGQTPCSLQRC